jgi:hypothetical protein
MFGFIFTIEASLKIFALGCIRGKETYFKKGWNVLDFIIVICGLAEFILEEL